MKQLWSDRSGSTLTLIGIFASLLAIIFAITANLSLAYLDKKRSQSNLDITALMLVSGGDASAVSAADLLARKGMRVSPDQINLLTGVYTEDPDIAVDERFVPATDGWNAIRLSMDVAIEERVLAGMIDNINTFSISSTATHRVVAQAWLGSRLLRLDGGLSEALLNALLGYEGDVRLVDHSALVSADVSILDFLSALKTQANLTALTYDDVLNASVKVSDISAALAAVTGQDTLTTELKSGRKLGSARIKLKDLITLGRNGLLDVGAEPNSGNVLASAGDLLMASLSLANGTHQIDLGATVLDGLATVALEVGDHGHLMHWNFDAARGDTVHTAQLRLKVSQPTTGLIVQLSLAEANGRIVDVACTNDRKPKLATIEVATDAAELELRLSGRKVLSLNLSDDAVQTLTFDASDIRDQVVKTTRSGLDVKINETPLVYRPILKLVDKLLVDLGLNLAEVDVQVRDLNCSRPYLVR